jgi:NAD(P)-dependent dehydrogenase (short-subunit alcohol dehydrogenase family)
LHREPFRNKVVVVTGGASGIGWSLCRRFGRAGAVIGLLDMDEKGIQTRTDELRGQGVEAMGLPCDVTRESACTRAIGEVVERYGGIDVLVNNAGITQRSAFVDTQSDVFHRVMAVNFFGSLYCTKAALESLLSRRGAIIVMESIAGIAPLLGRSAYSASKHALHGLFTSLRSEIRDTGVHVMIVCPGFVRTNLQTRALGGDGRITDHLQSKVGKEVSPERVAEAVYRGVIRRRSLVVLSPVGKVSYWINRLCPSLYERIMARQLKDELTR